MGRACHTTGISKLIINLPEIYNNQLNELRENSKLLVKYSIAYSKDKNYNQIETVATNKFKKNLNPIQKQKRNHHNLWV